MVIKLDKTQYKPSSRGQNIKKPLIPFNLTQTLKRLRYRLEPYSNKQKTICPSCGQKTFVHYLDTETGGRVHEGLYGKCDREIECTYHLRVPFEPKDIAYVPRRTSIYQPAPAPSKPDTLPFEYVAKRRARIGDGNVFVGWLRSLFHDDLTNYLIDRYHIGTTNDAKHETIFWQVDEAGQIRTGKTILYGTDGKRRKDVKPPVNWIHSKMVTAGTIDAYELKQCLFGLHLLTPENKDAPIYVFEAEKTAVVASVFYRNAICLATGAKEHLNADLLKPLRGRRVTFFPDKGAAGEWEAKLKALGVRAEIALDLEDRHDLKKDADCADTLELCDVTKLALNEPAGYPIFWDYLFLGDERKLA